MYKILTFPDRNLRNISEEVVFFDQHLHLLLDNMKEILKQNNALGLASIQIGIAKRAMLIKDSKNDIIEIINPQIISSEGKQYKEESCLSFPNVSVKVERPEQIHFKYQDRFGENKEAVVYGLEAIEFQHEYEHCFGIMIVDKVNRQERKKIQSILGKEK